MVKKLSPFFAISSLATHFLAKKYYQFAPENTLVQTKPSSKIWKSYANVCLEPIAWMLVQLIQPNFFVSAKKARAWQSGWEPGKRTVACIFRDFRGINFESALATIATMRPSANFRTRTVVFNWEFHSITLDGKWKKLWSRGTICPFFIRSHATL